MNSYQGMWGHELQTEERGRGFEVLSSEDDSGEALDDKHDAVNT